MNIFLWIVQGLIALMFGFAGFIKSTKSKQELEEQMPWTKDFSKAIVRFIGISEFLGAVGVILPELLGIVPVLTPIASAGLALIMILAIFYHLPKKEFKEIGINTFLFALTAMIAYFRF